MPVRQRAPSGTPFAPISAIQREPSGCPNPRSKELAVNATLATRHSTLREEPTLTSPKATRAAPTSGPGSGPTQTAPSPATEARRSQLTDGPHEPLLTDSLTDPLTQLSRFLARLSFERDDPLAVGDALRALVDAGFDRLPLPGQGRTLERWRMLGAVAERDLGLVKLFEGHTDALAILAELRADAPPSGSRWGVWAAEAPEVRLRIQRREDDVSRHDEVDLFGTKAWCSGAASLTHALVTCRDSADRPQLVAVALEQPGVRISTRNWHAVGMAATASAEVHFEHVRAHLVGAPGAYVSRPGFWHGGGGIAACWFGAAQLLAHTLHAAAKDKRDSHRSAHLGAVDVALDSAAAVLRETAAWIDRTPRADPIRPVLRARLQVEQAATAILEHACRALGAGPLCRDEAFAHCAADLPVFLRQSHAERDLAALGDLLAQQEHDNLGWKL
jgi:alkylation response protein AidB-like acyl-CoA dehydrogenase